MMMRACAFVGLMTAAIGCDSGTPHQGDWHLSSVDCAGDIFSVTGMISTLQIRDDVAAIDHPEQDCAMGIVEIPVTTDAAGNVSIDVGATAVESVYCSPTACCSLYLDICCQDGEWVTDAVYDNVQVDGNELVAQWNWCDYTWVRD